MRLCCRHTACVAWLGVTDADVLSMLCCLCVCLGDGGQPSCSSMVLSGPCGCVCLQRLWRVGLRARACCAVLWPGLRCWHAGAWGK